MVAVLRFASSLLASSLLVFALPLSAQQYPAQMLSGLRMARRGPHARRPHIRVAGNAAQPDTFYMGSVGGGVWKTENAGRTWFPIADDAATGIPIGSIGAIAVAPSDPNIVYVGTGEPDIRSQHSYGIGVFKSTDAGKTWHSIGLAETRQIGKIVSIPPIPNRVYVAAQGHVYKANPERGVYRSTDGGAHWKKILSNAQAIRTMWAQSIWRSTRSIRAPSMRRCGPRAAAVVGLCAIEYARRRPLQIDRRRRHVASAGRRPSRRRFVGKIGIAIAPSNPNRLYAVVDDLGAAIARGFRVPVRLERPHAQAFGRHLSSLTMPARRGSW
jgi:hypothetical protein